MVISPPSLPTPMTQRLQLQPGSTPRRTSLVRDLNPRPPPEPPDPPDRVPPHRCCSVFLRSSPNFMSIGTPVVLSGLKVSSTVLFSWESQTIKLVAFHARCITLAGPLPLRFRSVSQTLKSVHFNLSFSVFLRLEDPCHQPPQIYLLSQLLASDVGGNPLRRPVLSHMFLNLATDVGGNPLRRPVLSHQKLVRSCCRRTTLTSSSVVESTSLPCLLSMNGENFSDSFPSFSFSLLTGLLPCGAVCTGPEGAIEITSVSLVGEDCFSTSLVTISLLSDFVVKALSTYSSLALNSLSTSYEDLSCLVLFAIVVHQLFSRGR
ncbi:hypothetical protein IGI04_005070 [Brassica rapa subsp. trilocularis]|uniref:Uncharacterized protein n=1 Tax=Brassica rapa subsp. trilocularis TaxID=1813537 RepID=A0ABQ7NCY8_BRACM|nr:hypothetical protein IGI04_005070 [Brassica rapa subsp. trilocularis]